VGVEPEGLTLRAATAADEPFLREAYASSRAPELAIVPWDEMTKRAFCDQQFDAQITYYRQTFPETEDLVVRDGNTRVGRLIKARTPHELHLLDIVLLPGHRNRGLGSALLRGLQEEARTAMVPIVLYVDVKSGAVAFYRRHGFVVTSEDALHFAMKWVHGPRNDGSVPAQNNKQNTNNRP
jgi:ribosomal protein S18 acetylase RimI-like enzyme